MNKNIIVVCCGLYKRCAKVHILFQSANYFYKKNAVCTYFYRSSVIFPEFRCYVSIYFINFASVFIHNTFLRPPPRLWRGGWEERLYPATSPSPSERGLGGEVKLNNNETYHHYLAHAGITVAADGSKPAVG